jgi:hypothetical protein
MSRESVKVNRVAKYLCYILLTAVCTHTKGFKKTHLIIKHVQAYRNEYHIKQVEMNNVFLLYLLCR